jgi:regulator of protease activity HflC (stomatin/prohibitin superfamily)
VPQQHAWVVEKLGKYDRTLTPGLKFILADDASTG